MPQLYVSDLSPYPLHTEFVSWRGNHWQLSGDKDSTGPDNDNQSKEQQRVEMSYRVFAGKILVEAGLQTLK